MQYEQLDIFALIENPKETKDFSWDSDINEIHKMLTEFAKQHCLPIGKTEWEIWEHVPQYGYRMTFEIEFQKEQCTDEILKELNKIVEFAKERSVELSPTQPYWYNGDETATMYIFSTFMDKKRQKMK